MLVHSALGMCRVVRQDTSSCSNSGVSVKSHVMTCLWSWNLCTDCSGAGEEFRLSSLQLEVTLCSQLIRECHHAAQALRALSSEQTCLLLTILSSGQGCLVALSAATQEAAFHSISDILKIPS